MHSVTVTTKQQVGCANQSRGRNFAYFEQIAPLSPILLERERERYIYIYTHTHIYTHTRTLTHTHTYIHTHIHNLDFDA
jgi:hypothetical protein